MNQKLVILFLLTTVRIFSQKTEVIHASGFKHDYAVGKLEIVESAPDTVRLKYIATLRITQEKTGPHIVTGWLDLMEIKANALGANCYLVETYSETEGAAEMFFRVYFGPESFLKSNRLKRKTNAAVLFGQARSAGDTASFYLNDTLKVTFNPRTFYILPLEPGKTCYIATNKSNITAQKLHFKKTKPAVFYIIPYNKSVFAYGSTLPPNALDLRINGGPVVFKRNAPYELNYQLGRLMMEVYR